MTEFIASLAPGKDLDVSVDPDGDLRFHVDGEFPFFLRLDQAQALYDWLEEALEDASYQKYVQNVNRKYGADY